MKWLAILILASFAGCLGGAEDDTQSGGDGAWQLPALGVGSTLRYDATMGFGDFDFDFTVDMELLADNIYYKSSNHYLWYYVDSEGDEYLYLQRVSDWASYEEGDVTTKVSCPDECKFILQITAESPYDSLPASMDIGTTWQSESFEGVTSYTVSDRKSVDTNVGSRNVIEVKGEYQSGGDYSDIVMHIDEETGHIVHFSDVGVYYDEAFSMELNVRNWNMKSLERTYDETMLRVQEIFELELPAPGEEPPEEEEKVEELAPLYVRLSELSDLDLEVDDSLTITAESNGDVQMQITSADGFMLTGTDELVFTPDYPGIYDVLATSTRGNETQTDLGSIAVNGILSLETTCELGSAQVVAPCSAASFIVPTGTIWMQLRTNGSDVPYQDELSVWGGSESYNKTGVNGITITVPTPKHYGLWQTQFKPTMTEAGTHLITVELDMPARNE